jgi:ubiquinone biosynthesis protein
MAFGGVRPDRRTELSDAVRDAVAEWRRDLPPPSAIPVTRPADRATPLMRDPNREPLVPSEQRPVVPHAPGPPGIMASIPRRAALKLEAGESGPPQMRTVAFQVNRATACRRLVVWVGMLARFGAVVVWDTLRRNSTTGQRAVRLRQIFERRGGTYIKIGQHLARRLDFLPWEYGSELSGMLDRVPPFSATDAIAIVEQTTGKPLAKTFARFDPDPVGSNSLSCTYQAILHSGEKVVVKVRRPGAGELFMADLKVLDWLAHTLEFLTILRPGRTHSMRSELRDTLVEEMDFVQEARYMDLFRRTAKKSGRRFFTAPRVHFELSGEQVIVQEFVAGMWLWELVAAVEQKNQSVLDLAQQLEIDPARIARRLAFINYWAWHGNFFFRAEPHPDRIIIGAGGIITFIDFGSVGAIDTAKRRALQQNMYYASKQDPLNMARASLILLEPLPAVDPNVLTKELEACNWEMLFAFETRPSTGGRFTRTSAQQWIGLIRLARRFRIVIDFHILRLLQGVVTYDTLAVRLDPRINVITEYRRFARYRAARARVRARRRLLKNASRIPDTRGYLRLEQLADTGESLFFRLRHALAIPHANFNSLMSKGSVFVYTGIKFAAEMLGLTAVSTAAVVATALAATGHAPGFRDAFNRAIGLVAFRVMAALLVLINTRKMLFRMDDKDQ